MAAVLRTTFDRGPERWCSYDYHESVLARCNIFILTTHESSGGVNGSGYVWADEHRWSADTPEVPLSILPLIYYRSWDDEGAVDLRGADVSVYLRGDGLEPDGASCYFWVHAAGTRWHYTARPLEISDGRWAGEPLRFTLENDESRWHMSWTGRSEGPEPLDTLLGEAISYGFSFVGFSQEVRGRLSMDELEIRLAGSEG